MSAQTEAPVSRRSLRAPRQPFFEARDLYRIPLWFLQKPLYAFAPISLHFRLASLMGTVDFLSPRARTRLAKTLETHLGGTTGRRELQRIARRHEQARRKGQFTLIWPNVRNFAGVGRIPIEGLEHLDEALARGKGAILVSAYFGYVRMIKPVMRSRGRPIVLVGHPQATSSALYGREPRLTRVGTFVHTRLLHLPQASLTDARWRDALGTDLATSFDLREVVEALERNQTLGILADGRRTEARHLATVAGVEIPFAPGAVSIARSTGAALLPTFVVDEPGRSGPASLRLVIHPPLELQVTDDARADTQENLRRFARVYEAQTRAYPHNFLWERWLRLTELDPRSRRPQGASPSPYAQPRPDRRFRRPGRERASSHAWPPKDAR